MFGAWTPASIPGQATWITRHSYSVQAIYPSRFFAGVASLIRSSTICRTLRATVRVLLVLHQLLDQGSRVRGSPVRRSPEQGCALLVCAAQNAGREEAARPDR